MRDIKYLIISFLVLILINISVQAQGNDGAYQFPVRPGTPEWKSLKTHTEMLRAVQLPLDAKKNMLTKDLLETCLAYPLFIDMWASNNIKDGFEYVKKDFNGFEELFQRNDAFIELFKSYKSMDPELVKEKNRLADKGKFTAEFCKIEMILAHSDLLIKVSNQDKESLLLEIVNKKNRMVNHVEFDVKNMETNIYLMGRILNELDGRLKQRVSKKVRLFIETSNNIDDDTVVEIVSQTTNYLKNK